METIIKIMIGLAILIIAWALYYIVSDKIQRKKEKRYYPLWNIFKKKYEVEEDGKTKRDGVCYYGEHKKTKTKTPCYHKHQKLIEDLNKEILQNDSSKF